MTDFRVTLKSNIQLVELKKKNVKVTCYNANSGNTVIKTISQNASLLGTNNYNFVKGIDGAKDFKVKFNNKADAETFHKNITAIINDNSIITEEAETSKIENFLDKYGDGILDTITEVKDRLLDNYLPETSAPAPATPKNDNTTVIVVGAAFVMLIVIILVVWKMQK